VSGRIFLFGDDIDTDQLAPGQYMRGGIEALAAHCLEATRPDFAINVQPGDIIVAGRNFGTGSSREQAVEALRYLQVAGVIALSFAGIFYRNAINLGLPVLIVTSIDGVKDGDKASLDLTGSVLNLIVRNTDIALEPMPENLQEIIESGGLVQYLKKRLAAESKEQKNDIESSS
jgi:3-isopropylmalate/(R)-2-methylmalate dehydratase small subunit|tara:strand:- start:624 stop:1145 length:522 start_codon:yes stop_codon:yes gene_type:complete